MRTIFRDPFARGELVRRSVRPRQCVECGQPARYQYDWADDGRDRSFQRRPFARFDNGKVFCSIGCYRSYYV